MVNHGRRLAAIAAIGVLYCQARLPKPSSAEIAQRFHFDGIPLFASLSEALTPGVGVQVEDVEGHRYFVRNVHPSLHHIRSWVSSVGAAVALNDLKGDGLCNDVVLVDPRINGVMIGPVPGSESSQSDYAPFLLPAPTDEDGQVDKVRGPEGAATVAPMGVTVGDFNEDGKQDVLVYYWGRSPVFYLRNPHIPWPSGNNPAKDVYAVHELCTPAERWFTNTVTQADLDGDGHVDLIIGNYFPDYAHVLNQHGTGTESMQDSMSAAYNGGRNRFFLWARPESTDAQVRFREAIPRSSEVARVSEAIGALGETDIDSPTVTFVDGSGRTLNDREVSRLLCGWTLALASGDLDGDLYPEVYFANDFGPDRFLYNRTSKAGDLRFTVLEGRRTLTTPKSKILGRDSFKGMGVDFADINRNGMLAICVSNIASPYALEESHAVFVDQSRPGGNIQDRRVTFGKLARTGVTPYQDRSEELGLSRSGWAWDWKFASFDNGLDLEGIQATGFVKGHATSPLPAWMTKARPVDAAQGLIKGVRDRWPVLHELATGNDQRLSKPWNWAPMGPGDDLSGHQRKAFFVRAANGRYCDVATDVDGLERNVEEPAVARGIAVADVDGDGRLDFAVANQWETSFFHHNSSSDTGYCLELRLLLPLEAGQAELEEVSPLHVARIAIGATATIHLASGETLTAQVDGGNGHSGKNAPEIHFGLGKTDHSEDPVDVEISWRDPDGKPHTILKQHLSVGRPGHPEEHLRHTLLLPWPQKNDVYAQHSQPLQR